MGPLPVGSPGNGAAAVGGPPRRARARLGSPCGHFSLLERPGYLLSSSSPSVTSGEQPLQLRRRLLLHRRQRVPVGVHRERARCMPQALAHRLDVHTASEQYARGRVAWRVTVSVSRPSASPSPQSLPHLGHASGRHTEQRLKWSCGMPARLAVRCRSWLRSLARSSGVPATVPKTSAASFHRPQRSVARGSMSTRGSAA